MDFQTLANLGEIIGAVAVVISLIYLAIQVRQNTTAQQIENYTRALDRVSSLQAQFGKDGETAMMFARGVRDANSLTRVEKVRFTWILYEMFGALEFMFHASQSDAMPEEVWTRWSMTVRYWMNHPGVMTWWKLRPVPFTKSFTAFVESVAENDPEDDLRAQRWQEFVGAA